MFKLKKLVAIALVGAAFASPIAPAAVPDSGLLVTRMSAKTWQVRLISGTTAQQFTGTVESSFGITGIYAGRLESNDVAKISPSTTLNLQYETTPGTFDSVQFWGPAGSDICLRDLGTSGVKVYLGATLATAVAISTPAALQGLDPCHLIPPPPPEPPRKFHPGHYVAMLRKYSSQTSMTTATAHANVAGVMKRYTWRKLEPTQGVYDFSEVASDLAWAAAHGLHFVVMIEDKTFVNEMPMPDYLASYAMRNTAGGYTAQRWSPYVVARMNALTAAFGARFDANPALEGIVTSEETAPSVDGATLDAFGYTPELYRDAYINTLTTAAKNLPTSRIFFYQNYFPRNQNYISSIINATMARGIVLGGPDNVPDDVSLNQMNYSLYSTYHGKVKMFIQVEGRCYVHEHATAGYSTKYWTMPELYAFARDTLHSNYIWWVNIPKPLYTDSYAFPHVIPVIEANPVINP